jgi:LemA protein
MTFILVLVAIVGGFALVIALGMYNGLIALRQQVERAWANIDVILKQRYDEIPQLVQVVEQYAQYEKGLIEQVAKARAHYGSANSISEKIDAGKEMSAAFRGLFALAEAYPDLKANQNFLQLQSRVSTLETTLSDRRETFNDTTTNFNTRIQQIPHSFFAKMLGYRPEPLYQIESVERERPSLKMNIGA